jgi:hypothetical protein
MIFDADRCTSQSWMATTHIDCAKDIPEPYVRYAFEAVAGGAVAIATGILNSKY